MSQQYPTQQSGRGGRGSAGPGGRGGGPPGPGQGQPYPSYPGQNPGRGGGGPRPMGAWQPNAPTSSLQQAPAGYPQQQQHQQQHQQQQQQRPPAPGYAQGPPQGYYNPYAQAQAAQQYNAAPRGPWQGQPAGYPPTNMRGGVFYPPPQGGAAPPGQQPQQPAQQQQQATPVAAAGAPNAQAPAPRARKPLVITDKDGNVISFAPKKAAAAATPAASAATPTSTASATPAEPAQDHGALLRQAAMDRIKAEDTTKKATADAKTKDGAEAKAKQEAEVKAKQEAEEKAKQEAEAKAKKEAEEKIKKAKEAVAPKASFSALLKQPAPVPVAKAAPTYSSSGRIIFVKADLLRFKERPNCQLRPDSLPDMTITRGPTRGKSGGAGGGNNRGGNRSNDGGGGGGGGSDWGRGAAPPRQQAQNREGGGGGGGGGNRGSGGGGNDWSRGQAPPKQQPQQQGQQQGKHGRGGRGQPPPLYDGPVAPLVKSENHWKPKKSKSAIDFAEKKVKSILNKMTKEKFDRLSTQMMEIPILSYEMLNIMIENVYDKAIDEPTFGDMYADLCVRLSQTVKGSAFVHILKSDEEAPTEGEANAPAVPNGDETSSYTVYRWSNDVSTTDTEIVGPFATADECVVVAVDMENEQTPTERGEMELELVSVSIQKGIFIKIMKKKEPEEDENEIFYTIYFPVVEAEDCDQQLSDIFLSEMECRSDATKKNSFKSSLLNKCEVEFNKQDIYEGWKTEKKEYEAIKSTMTAPERKEAESEFNFRRIKIKKQMLGNIKFIGQLFKKGLLKEKIMRFCIASLLKLEELKGVKTKNPEYKDSGDTDMDEEDHEAICSMFGTVGATLELPHAVDFMHVCFSKINALSNDTALPSRSRFMYKDLLDLRANRWVPRRKEEKAKTLEEIRKDVEIEERKQQQQSSRGGGGGGGGRGGDFRNSGDARGGRQQQSFPSSNRPRQPKPATHTDADGFTVIGAKPNAPVPAPKSQTPKPAQSRTPLAVAKKSTPADGGAAASKATNAPDALSDEKLEKSIKSMRTDFVSDGGSMDELLLSMHEISGTPGAGVKIVSLNVDRLMDCKDDERKAINSIIKILFEKKKITSDDVKNGFMDAIEFIDSFVMDSPRAYEYLGNLLGSLLQIKAFDVEWLCEQLEKTKADPDTVAPVKLIRYTITSAGPSAKGSFSAADKALVGLLGADSWKTISTELLN